MRLSGCVKMMLRYGRVTSCPKEAFVACFQAIVTRWHPCLVSKVVGVGAQVAGAGGSLVCGQFASPPRCQSKSPCSPLPARTPAGGNSILFTTSHCHDAVACRSWHGDIYVEDVVVLTAILSFS
jgi:hypothetical protein